jgi:hypothetical protein
MDFLAVIDWADLVTDATAGVTTNVEGAVVAIAPVILGIAGILLAFRKVRGLLH